MKLFKQLMKFKKLHQTIINEIHKYLNLHIGQQKVRTPYYQNRIQLELFSFIKANLEQEEFERVYSLVKPAFKEQKVNYGWYRGKGAPEEIEQSYIELTKNVGIFYDGNNVDLIRTYMEYVGLGVDCSGFVYNILAKGFDSIEMLDAFVDSLAWRSDNKYVGNAGTFVFRGDGFDQVEPRNVQSLDIVLLLDSKKVPSHVGIVIEIENKLHFAQSTLRMLPHGVHLTTFDRLEDVTYADEKNLGCYINHGQIEIWRLKMLDNLT
jgi:hypothetical protein